MDSPNPNFHFFPRLTFCVTNANEGMKPHVLHSAVIVLGTHSGKFGDWGWEIVFPFFCKQQLQNAVSCKESFVFTCLTYKNVQCFQNGLSTNSMAWKLAKWEKVMLVLTNTHMLKKLRIFVSRISKVRQTTSNWIVRILN